MAVNFIRHRNLGKAADDPMIGCEKFPLDRAGGKGVWSDRPPTPGELGIALAYCLGRGSGEVQRGESDALMHEIGEGPAMLVNQKVPCGARVINDSFDTIEDLGIARPIEIR